MQFSSLVTALTASSVVLAAPIIKRSPGKAIIVNHCDFDVKITPWVNGSPTTESTIPAGQSWSETQRASGQSTSLKVSLDSSNNVAQFEYTTNNDMALVFYDLSFLDGNPFSGWKQALTGGEEDPNVSCAAGELPCQEAYFFPDQVATKAAPMGTDLTYEICKKN